MKKRKKIYFSNDVPSIDIIENQFRKRIKIELENASISQFKFRKSNNRIHLIDKASGFPIISTPMLNLSNRLILVSSNENSINIDIIYANSFIQKLKTIVKYIIYSLFHKSPSSAKL